MWTTLRTALPLVGLTAVGLLATDLYLPALPGLPSALNGTIASAQATLTAFTASLAISQLLWGAASDRFGHRAVLAAGMLLQALGGLACALAPGMTALIVARAVQGLGVGAAMVVVPTVLRSAFHGTRAVRALSWLGIAESMVPALAPIAGALLLTRSDWRFSFWIVLAALVVVWPWAWRAIPPHQRAAAPPTRGGYVELLAHRAYAGYALGHALCFGALISFVASAPQVVAVWLGAGPATFALLQAFGVSAFVLMAASSGFCADRYGVDRIIMAGVALQVVAAAGFLALAWLDIRSLAGLIAGWSIFCGALGLRGPATMTRALDVPGRLAGRAAGLMMFMAFCLAAVATQGVADYLTLGLMPIAAVCLGFTIASALLIIVGITGREKRAESAPT
ncbi:MFS transporter [Bordetella flabilis]|uniref:MFS transporter n=1 Tax=Bordetella flabilis TaxID=463014 RepID=A0A193GBB1_9BORD|nr:MFS transporter [Bordetella flabilis]ANN76564.1 MFS transporter [Bordetella flabilis]